MGITNADIITMLKASRPILSDSVALNTIDMFPTWESIINVEITQDMVNKGYDRYQYNGDLYKIIQPHTPQIGWEPDKTPALWLKISLDEWPEWVRPTGAHDAYSMGTKVTHNNKKWTSDLDNNVWEPGEYGWTEKTA